MTTEKDTPADEQLSYEQTVAKHVDSMVADDKGKMQLPEGTELDEGTAYAVNSERRRRDTQAALAIANNESTVLKAENAGLVKGWEKDLTATLTVQQNDDLAELKATDPDAWREKLNEYEAANLEAFGATRQTIKDNAHKETELEQRTRLLQEFNDANPNIAITDDLLANDVPPRYLKDLEAGKITFAEMLDKVQSFLTTGKVIKKTEAPGDDTDLGELGGSSKPANDAVDADARQSYKTETY